MVNDRVKVFQNDYYDEFEDAMNCWLAANPQYYIRQMNIFMSRSGRWVGYVWYTKINLEEEPKCL